MPRLGIKNPDPAKGNCLVKVIFSSDELPSYERAMSVYHPFFADGLPLKTLTDG